jgi:hypothetical protein
VTVIPRLKWIYISAFAFVISIGIAILLIIFAGKLSSYGVTKSFYYILLV